MQYYVFEDYSYCEGCLAWKFRLRGFISETEYDNYTENNNFATVRQLAESQGAHPDLWRPDQEDERCVEDAEH